MHLTDGDERQGMRWSRSLSLQIVWFSITQPEILKWDVVCRPCWKVVEAVKAMNLLFSEYFACDKIPHGLACVSDLFF